MVLAVDSFLLHLTLTVYDTHSLDHIDPKNAVTVPVILEG